MQLVQNYNEKPDLITDMVIGMSDGFVIPLALTTGLYSAGMGGQVIIYAGFIVAVIGSLAMAFARFFAAREDAEHHEEIASGHSDEHMLEHIGIDEETRDFISSEVARDRQEWKEMMEANALSPEAFNAAYSRKSGLYIGLSYLIAGIIPVAPFLFVPDLFTAWLCSVGVTVFLLLIFGYFKGRATAVN
jgi:vacuolar iron transporter family protein